MAVTQEHESKKTQLRFGDGVAMPTRALLLLGYVLPLAYGTWLPLANWDWSAGGMDAFLAMDIAEFTTPLDALLNLIIYMPVGFLFASLVPGTPVTRIVFATLVGCALSLVMEFGQTFLPGRFPSLSDLGLNTFGSLAGAFMWRWWR